ncbi:hypothetical protein FCI23_49970 [Actinacidiphila oryziradicis]|uniref:Lipoyl-binding domain-containing protein n=1 Tax=Actinacidiphila oryziradicis TaxID=2571141 RepID=A0A4U0RMM6_9ACTN|nr:hypothetical protein FCI23_49970 [Actinacidiphila oryziradicis]
MPVTVRRPVCATIPVASWQNVSNECFVKHGRVTWRTSRSDAGGVIPGTISGNPSLRGSWSTPLMVLHVQYPCPPIRTRSPERDQTTPLQDRDPLQSREGSLRAPMPGTVIRIGEFFPGDQVRAGQPLLWLEAMKMEHVITAPVTGTLTELTAEVGRQVELGTVLAVVKEEPGP